MNAVSELYRKIVNENLLVRRITITATNIVDREHIPDETPLQLNLFTNYFAEDRRRQTEMALLDKERRIQEAILSVHRRFGKNSIMRGMSLEEGATTIERNGQIGGHRK